MARKDYIVGSGNVFEDLGHPRPGRKTFGRMPSIQSLCSIVTACSLVP